MEGEPQSFLHKDQTKKNVWPTRWPSLNVNETSPLAAVQLQRTHGARAKRPWLPRAFDVCVRVVVVFLSLSLSDSFTARSPSGAF